MSTISVYLTKTETGTYLGATNEAPFLCIEAATEREVEVLASRALQFYQANKHRSAPVISQTQTVGSFRSIRVVPSDMLLAVA